MCVPPFYCTTQPRLQQINLIHRTAERGATAAYQRPKSAPAVTDEYLGDAKYLLPVVGDDLEEGSAKETQGTPTPKTLPATPVKTVRIFG